MNTTSIRQPPPEHDARIWREVLALSNEAPGNAGHLAYVSDFLEEAKATGLVKQIIDQASLRGLQVAPSGKAN